MSNRTIFWSKVVALIGGGIAGALGFTTLMVCGVAWVLAWGVDDLLGRA